MQIETLQKSNRWHHLKNEARISRHVNNRKRCASIAYALIKYGLSSNQNLNEFIYLMIHLFTMTFKTFPGFELLTDDMGKIIFPIYMIFLSIRFSWSKINFQYFGNKTVEKVSRKNQLIFLPIMFFVEVFFRHLIEHNFRTEKGFH